MWWEEKKKIIWIWEILATPPYHCSGMCQSLLSLCCMYTIVVSHHICHTIITFYQILFIIIPRHIHISLYRSSCSEQQWLLTFACVTTTCPRAQHCIPRTICKTKKNCGRNEEKLHCNARWKHPCGSTHTSTSASVPVLATRGGKSNAKGMPCSSWTKAYVRGLYRYEAWCRPPTTFGSQRARKNLWISAEDFFTCNFRQQRVRISKSMWRSTRQTNFSYDSQLATCTSLLRLEGT